ncbi:hypothetical protein [Brachybacterium sp. AOP42-B2-9]|uniref:hypothetical protein n=1 Tax=Brachybacterium sp. AOP42-B2-9 TaxID=3457672 RepID=UPI0040336F90
MMLVLGTFAITAVHSPSPASAAPVPRGTETSLGPAFDEKVLSPQIAHGTGTDGRSLTYYVTSGNTAMGALFQAIDTLSGQVVFEQRVGEGVDAWAMAVSGDTVVFTVNDIAAHLYSWTPGDAEVTSLGAAFGEESVWSMTAAPDGTVYAGSYPTGRLWEVDVSTGDATAIAIPNAGESYLRALTADDEYVYAGSLGTGKLARVNRSTTAISAITLPTPKSGTNNTITDLALRGRYLMVISPSAPAMYVYDTKAGSFVKTVEINGSGDRLPASTAITGVNSAISPVDPSGRYVYFQRSNFGLGELDLRTLEYARTGYSTQTSPRDMVWLDTGFSGWANPSLIVAGALGTQWAYDTSVRNLSSRPGRQRDLQPDVGGAPGEIRSLGAGPDGRVYIGGFQNPTGVRIFDPATSSFDEIRTMPQVEGFGTAGSKVLMGGYPRAQLLTYDPAAPAGYNGAEDDFSLNPSLHELGSGQERPFDFVELGDGTVGVATVAVKSAAGGAFTVWTPNSDETRTYRNPIPNQSVVALEEVNGVVVAGSSINGGTGYSPTESKSELFTIDPATGEVLSSLVPSDQGNVPWVNAFSVDPSDQTLWGIAGRVLFHAEVAEDGTLTVLKKQKLFENNPGFYGNDFSTFVRDGVVYATADGNLYAINPLTFEKTTLATGGITDMVVVGNRDLYYAKDNLELFRYRLPVQTAVAAPLLGSHTQTDVYNPGSTVFSGIGTPGSTVTVTTAGSSVTARVDADGTWTAPAVRVPEGTHEVSLVARLDGATSATVTSTVQFSAPISTPGITSHRAGQEYPAGEVSFHGTGTRGSTVTLTVAGERVTTPVYSSGQWFAPPIQVPAGRQMVTLSASKDGYTTPQTSTTLTFVNDVASPQLTSPAVGSTTAAGTVDLHGTADPYAEVTVTAGGRTVTVPTYSSGMWFAEGMRIPSGNQAIYMTAELDGLSSPTVRTVRYFDSALEQPALLSPAASAATPAGMVSFYGTATRGATVTVTVDGRSVTAPTYSSGMWFAPPLHVGAGTQTITITSTLDGQSTSPVSVQREFTDPVQAPALVSPAEGSATASGMVSFYGTSTPGASVTLTVGNQTVTALTYSSGMWFAPPVQVAPGNQSIYMTASSVDFTSPTVRTVRYFDSALEQPALVSPAASASTPAGMVSFYGTATRGAAVTVTVDGRSVTAPTYSSGMWFAPPIEVPAGTQTITITSTLDGQSTSPVFLQREFTNPVESPALVSPAEGSTTASGMVSLYGTSTPGAVVTVTVGDQAVSALTYSSGMWFTPPVQVSPGNQSVHMTAEFEGFSSPTVRSVRYFR